MVRVVELGFMGVDPLGVSTTLAQPFSNSFTAQSNFVSSNSGAAELTVQLVAIRWSYSSQTFICNPLTALLGFLSCTFTCLSVVPMLPEPNPRFTSTSRVVQVLVFS
jgi:hypothetical protein